MPFEMTSKVRNQIFTKKMHPYVGYFVQANMFEKIRGHGGLNDLQSYWKSCTKCTFFMLNRVCEMAICKDSRLTYGHILSSVIQDDHFVRP